VILVIIEFDAPISSGVRPLIQDQLKPCRRRIRSDGCDWPWFLPDISAITEPRVTHDVGNAERVKRRSRVAIRHVARQFDEDLIQQKIAFDPFKELCGFLRDTGSQVRLMNQRGAVLIVVQRSKRRSDLALDPAPHWVTSVKRV
jgi:hypothetical protein